MIKKYGLLKSVFDAGVTALVSQIKPQAQGDESISAIETVYTSGMSIIKITMTVSHIAEIIVAVNMAEHYKR